MLKTEVLQSLHFWRLCPFVVESLLILWSPWVSPERNSFLTAVSLIACASLNWVGVFSFRYRCCFSGHRRWVLIVIFNWLFYSYIWFNCMLLRNRTCMWEEVHSGRNSKVGLLSEYNYRKICLGILGNFTFLINCSLNDQSRVLVLFTSWFVFIKKMCS